MAHEIDLTGAKPAMAYVGQVPWHGLGQQLTPSSPIEVWCKEAGMDWDIQATPSLYYQGDDVHCFPGRNVLLRSDTGGPLSIVSDSYKVVQPREVLEFYRDLVGTGGFELETAGCLFGGRKFWALARIGQEARIAGQDLLQGYLLLATSCDASLATTARFTSVRVVCNNTLSLAYRGDGQGVVKVPHNSRFQPELVKAELGLAPDLWATFEEEVTTLSKLQISDKEALEFMIRLMGNEERGLDEQPEAISNILRLYKGQGRGSDLRSSKGTMWGLVNGVTEFVDHHFNSKLQDSRLDRAWFGPGNTLKNRAMVEALKVAA